MRACNRCGLMIAFKRRNGSGAWMPTNPDGSDHWDTCKAQQRAKRSPDVIEGKTIIGERYLKLPCLCSVTPWEDCPNRAFCEMIGERK